MGVDSVIDRDSGGGSEEFDGATVSGDSTHVVSRGPRAIGSQTTSTGDELTVTVELTEDVGSTLIDLITVRNGTVARVRL